MDWQAVYSFWEWSENKIGFFHMYMALVAVVLGPIIFLRRKGDFVHRLMGLVYVFAMLATNITAFLIYDLTGGPNLFHIAATISLITAIGGLVSILIYAEGKSQKALAMHIDFMSWSYFGLFLAAVAESVTSGFGPIIGDLSSFWMVFGISMFIIGGIGSRITRKLVNSTKRRWIEHL